MRLQDSSDGMTWQIKGDTSDEEKVRVRSGLCKLCGKA